MKKMSAVLVGHKFVKSTGLFPLVTSVGRKFGTKAPDFDLKSVLDAPQKVLLTPGPLSTSPTVKAAMLRDFGSRDAAFIQLLASVRSDILEVAGVSAAEWSAVLMQGSGSFAVESAIQTSVPRTESSKMLVVSNGAYADRAAKQCAQCGIAHELLRFREDELPDLEQIARKLETESFSHVFVVHSETTSGLVNPIKGVGQLAAKCGAELIVDCMSSFGGIPFSMDDCCVHWMVTSANKCLQGVPGFGIIVAKRDSLLKAEGNARSLVLDAAAQWKGLEKDGQFRFTPPTHTLCAFRQALDELREEGGVAKRYQRYRGNQQIVTEALLELGFELYLPRELCGPIITSVRYPTSSNWDFDAFYRQLAARNFLIYPGKVTNADCFRIGHIGHVFAEDCHRLAEDMADICKAMKLF